MPEARKTGTVIAIDQGKTTCLTTSNRQIFKADPHRHTLKSIIDGMSRKKYGSNAFHRCVAHRKNYVHWTVHQLNLSGVKEIRLENIENINYGRNINRTLKHWTNTLIRDSIETLCLETGVLFSCPKSEYNSQRCSVCGWVHKANRKGKLFKCTACDFTEDADFNASQNILVHNDLSPLPSGFRSRRMNLKGFYWSQTGLFDRIGQELTVPVVPKNEVIVIEHNIS
jgi:transposase